MHAGANVKAGSSPRVRGKHGINPHLPIAVRIIPARAGQTPSENLTPTCKPDHPRACGANKAFSRLAMSAFGSSPRVRGKQGTVDLTIPENRIIPARAGQTGYRRRNRLRNTDHPRACGANVGVVHGALDVAGSSPRVRGKRPST